MAVRTVAEAKALRSPTLNRVKSESGYQKAQAVLFFELSEIVNFLNVGKTMSDHQIADTVRIIMQDYGYLTLADFRLFGNRYKKGRYGKSYDRLDGQTIIMGLDQYVEEKSGELESLNFERHNNIKKTLGISEMHPDVIAALKNAIGDKPIGKIEEKPRKPELDPVQRWTKQFYNLSGKFRINAPITMIRIGGITMDVRQFLERKLQNEAR